LEVADKNLDPAARQSVAGNLRHGRAGIETDEQ
jgi:hypothetical protein